MVVFRLDISVAVFSDASFNFLFSSSKSVSRVFMESNSQTTFKSLSSLEFISATCSAKDESQQCSFKSSLVCDPSSRRLLNLFPDKSSVIFGFAFPIAFFLLMARVTAQDGYKPGISFSVGSEV